MRRFKKILFVADGSKGEKSALTRAANLAQLNKAKLTLIDVLDLENDASVDEATRSSIQALQASVLERRKRELDRVRESIISRHSNVKVALEIESGKPPVAIIRSVLRHNHDLVIKAPENAASAGLFGSTDLKLMRKCPCPVWIDRPSRKRRYGKILAAIDLNPGEPETQSLARQIIEISTSLAELERSELHVVHVWRLAGEAKLRGRQVTTHNVDRLLREIRNAHKSELDGLLKKYPYEKMTVHLLKGRAGKVIPSIINELFADLVIIGTVGRTGIPGFFIGNTAEKVINAVSCSVLTLKPEGFETPIEV